MKLYETITAEKWHKGSMFGGQPGHACLLGHLLLPGVELESGTCDRLRAAVKALFPERGGATTTSVARFNDHPETTFEDVLRVLKFADV